MIFFFKTIGYSVQDFQFRIIIEIKRTRLPNSNIIILIKIKTVYLGIKKQNIYETSKHINIGEIFKNTGLHRNM